MCVSKSLKLYLWSKLQAQQISTKNCTNLVGLLSSCETKDDGTLDQEQNEQEFNIDSDLEVTEELD